MKTLICHVDEMVVDEVRPIEVGSESALLFRLEDGFYATQSRCTHMFRSLAKGKVKDGKIECPLHRAKFCIKTGDVKEWANFPPGVQLFNVIAREKSLKVYEVAIENGAVYVTG
ncbi:non-heme iron oxygenase ferredoxin subunit [Maricurvus nonylphenolicus]|uniref:Rieske (2Fe-2S) protein n=1 Tax=Maricurvus nonylphenolicus TaxID=1008307 RepID=UPI0036F3EE07